MYGKREGGGGMGWGGSLALDPNMCLGRTCQARSQSRASQANCLGGRGLVVFYKPQARLQEEARGSAILGPLWPMRSPAWQRQVKGRGQGQDAGLNGEGAMCRPQGEMGAEPRCWAVERHRANTEGGGPEGADGGSEPSSLDKLVSPKWSLSRSSQHPGQVSLHSER